MGNKPFNQEDGVGPRASELVAGVLLGICAIRVARAFMIASERLGKSDRAALRATVLPGLLAAVCVGTLLFV